MENRTLSTIAQEISSDWEKVNFAAVPYLQAMATMESPQDNFGYDSGQSVVLYFLSNATTWRGDVARRIKKELKAMI